MLIQISPPKYSSILFVPTLEEKKLQTIEKSLSSLLVLLTVYSLFKSNFIEQVFAKLYRNYWKKSWLREKATPTIWKRSQLFFNYNIQCSMLRATNMFIIELEKIFGCQLVWISKRFLKFSFWYSSSSCLRLTFKAKFYDYAAAQGSVKECLLHWNTILLHVNVKQRSFLSIAEILSGHISIFILPTAVLAMLHFLYMASKSLVFGTRLAFTYYKQAQRLS